MDAENIINECEELTPEEKVDINITKILRELKCKK